MSTPALIEDPTDPGTYLIQDIPAVIGSSTSSGYSPPAVGLAITTLSWNDAGERYFEAGVDRGVLYIDGAPGVAWNGLISVDETPTGGEPESYYLDGVKYHIQPTREEFEATIDAYSYPEVFALCDGSEAISNGLYISQQRRRPFGLAYRTKIGNDVNGVDHGYKLHILYNAMATPTDRSYSSLGDSPDALEFSWKLTSRPKKFEDAAFGVKIGAHLTIDSRVAYPWAMEAVEKVLYGDGETAPALPTPRQLLDLFIDNALLKVTDNGDGTATIVGPDYAMEDLGNDEIQITWDSVLQLTPNTVQISSR